MPHSNPSAGALAVLRYEPRLAAAQVRVMVIVGLISFAVVAITLYFGIVVLTLLYGLIVAMTAAIALLLRFTSGNLYATVTPKGLWLGVIDEMVPWSAIGSLTVIQYSMIAGRVHTGTAEHPAMGSKQINLIPKDLNYFTMLLAANYDFRLQPGLAWEPPATTGVNADFSAVASPRQWTHFVVALRRQAKLHGIPVRFMPEPEVN